MWRKKTMIPRTSNWQDWLYFENLLLENPALTFLCWVIQNISLFFQFKPYTCQPHYVKLSYLEYMAYVEVIIHSGAFSLYCFVFQTCLCRTRLSRNLGSIAVVFHSWKIVFCFFTTTCVKVKFVLVKKLNNINVRVINLQTSNNSL